MNQGIKTIIYPAKDIARAKALFSRLLGVEPFIDSPYYVGFKVGDQDIGLDPTQSAPPIRLRQLFVHDRFRRCKFVRLSSLVIWSVSNRSLVLLRSHLFCSGRSGIERDQRNRLLRPAVHATVTWSSGIWP